MRPPHGIPGSTQRDRLRSRGIIRRISAFGHLPPRLRLLLEMRKLLILLILPRRTRHFPNSKLVRVKFTVRGKASAESLRIAQTSNSRCSVPATEASIYQGDVESLNNIRPITRSTTHACNEIGVIYTIFMLLPFHIHQLSHASKLSFV